MKRAFIGLILAACVLLPIQVYSDSMVGKKVEVVVPVVIDGEELPVGAIAIEGTTYAPVRVLAEALGKDVDWVDGQVVIVSPENITEEEGEGGVELQHDQPFDELVDANNELPPSNVEQEFDAVEIKNEILSIKRANELTQKSIDMFMDLVVNGELSDDEVEFYQYKIEEARGIIELNNSIIAELEEKLSNIEEQQ